MEKKNNTILYILMSIIIVLLVALLVVILTTGKSDNNGNNNLKDNNEELSNQTNLNNTILDHFTKISESEEENTLKKGFIEIVDFLFYDEKINGVTFKEIKDEVKLKLFVVALKIDSKIEDYFPGYKKTISTGTKKIYDSIKTEVVEAYINITDKICSNNEELCKNAKKDFEKMKDIFGTGWDYLKDIGKTAKDKLENWYEDFRKE